MSQMLLSWLAAVKIRISASGGCNKCTCRHEKAGRVSDKERTRRGSSLYVVEDDVEDTDFFRPRQLLIANALQPFDSFLFPTKYLDHAQNTERCHSISGSIASI